MKPFAMIVAFVGLLLGGCDRYFGPVIRNDTSAPIEVWANYSNGEKSYVRLKPGTGLWKGKPGFIPEQIVIVQSGQRMEFDNAYLQSLLACIENKDSAVIAFDGKSLRGLSLAEAKRTTDKRLPPADTRPKAKRSRSPQRAEPRGSGRVLLVSRWQRRQ